MPSTSLPLPHDVLGEIIRNLDAEHDSGTLKAWALVARAHTSQAQRRLLAEIQLSCGRSWTSFAFLLAGSPHLAAYVLELLIVDVSILYEEENYTDLAFIVSAVSNLWRIGVIGIEGTCSFDGFAVALKSAFLERFRNVHSIFFHNVYALPMNYVISCVHLKELAIILPFGVRRDTSHVLSSEHLMNVPAHRSNLTSLTIGHIPSDIALELISKSQHFLEKLTLANLGDYPTDGASLNIDLPRLRELTVLASRDQLLEAFVASNIECGESTPGPRVLESLTWQFENGSTGFSGFGGSAAWARIDSALCHPRYARFATLSVCFEVVGFYRWLDRDKDFLRNDLLGSQPKLCRNTNVAIEVIFLDESQL
ncbi:hypothetical protein DXG01_007771 [Tephrocybe rancida]|nr:hypothetical protein DXG01_007771 [Tephrocybe rancida]